MKSHVPRVLSSGFATGPGPWIWRLGSGRKCAKWHYRRNCMTLRMYDTSSIQKVRDHTATSLVMLHQFWHGLKALTFFLCSRQRLQADFFRVRWNISWKYVLCEELTITVLHSAAGGSFLTYLRKALRQTWRTLSQLHLDTHVAARARDFLYCHLLSRRRNVLTIGQ